MGIKGKELRTPERRKGKLSESGGTRRSRRSRTRSKSRKLGRSKTSRKGRKSRSRRKKGTGKTAKSSGASKSGSKKAKIGTKVSVYSVQTLEGSTNVRCEKVDGKITTQVSHQRPGEDESKSTTQLAPDESTTQLAPDAGQSPANDVE